MTILFVTVLIAGLLLGVWSMIAGIDRDRRRGRWIKYVNLPTFAIAGTLFGLVGYPLAKYTVLSTGAILAIAGVVAIAGAVGMVALIAGWAVPSAAREVVDERYTLQGHLAVVTQAIGNGTGDIGAIAYEHEGRRFVVRARSLDGDSIEATTEVVIERVEDGVAYVERWATIARQLELPS